MEDAFIAALKFLAAILLVILNAVFVAAEFSFVKVRHTRIQQLVDEGSFKARIADFGVRHLDAYLSVCQLGITLSSLGLGWIGEPAVSELLKPLFGVMGIGSVEAQHSISIAVGFTLITFLHVVFGELAPKTIAIQKAEKVVLNLGILMRFFYVIFFPVVIIFNGTANLVLKLLKIHPSAESEHTHTVEELKMLVEDSYASGNIDEEEQAIIRNVFHFETKNAKDIMIPRLDAVHLSVKKSFEDNLKIIKGKKHTRYPIVDEDTEKVVGIFNIKDFFDRNEDDIIGAMREVLFVPENIALDRLLRKFQVNKQQLAVVVDEFGSYQGIISMEDVLEELVGEIKDEFDMEDENPGISHIGEGVSLVSGKMSIAELEEIIDLDYDFEEKDVSTVAGFALDCMGGIPKVGDSFQFDKKDFEIVEMDEQRIISVKVTETKEDEAEKEK